MTRLINFMSHHDYEYKVHANHVMVKIYIGTEGAYTITPVRNVSEARALLGY